MPIQPARYYRLRIPLMFTSFGLVVTTFTLLFYFSFFAPFLFVLAMLFGAVAAGLESSYQDWQELEKDEPRLYLARRLFRQGKLSPETARKLTILQEQKEGLAVQSRELLELCEAAGKDTPIDLMRESGRTQIFLDHEISRIITEHANM